MKKISWTQLKQKTISEIEEGECLEVTADGSMVFYVIIKPEQIMLDRVEGICSQIDKSRGF